MPSTKVKPLKKPRAKRIKKEVPPLLKYARRLRQNMRARVKKVGGDLNEVATANEFYEWLQNQEPFKCYYSGNSVTFKQLNIDHIEPLGLGGSSKFDNLCVTSSRMNKAKGSFTEKEWRYLMDLGTISQTGKNYLMSRLLAGFMTSRREI